MTSERLHTCMIYVEEHIQEHIQEHILSSFKRRAKQKQNRAYMKMKVEYICDITLTQSLVDPTQALSVVVSMKGHYSTHPNGLYTPRHTF